MHEVTEFDIGDEDAEDEYLQHRPGAQALDPAKDTSEVYRRPHFIDADQDIERSGQLTERRDGNDKDYYDGQSAHAAPHEFMRSGEQAGLKRQPRTLDSHQRRQAQDRHQSKSRNGQCKAALECVGGGTVQQGGTAEALGAHAGRQEGNCLQLPATVAFAQPGGRGRLLSERMLHRPVRF